MGTVTLRKIVEGGKYKIVDGEGFFTGTVVGHQWIDGVLRSGDTVTILGDEQKPDTSEIERLKAELKVSETDREELESQLAIIGKAVRGDSMPVVSAYAPEWTKTLDDVMDMRVALSKTRRELDEMRTLRNNYEAKLNMLTQGLNGGPIPGMREDDPRYSIGLVYLAKLWRERRDANNRADELQAKVHDLRNHLKNADAEILAYSLAERGNSGHKRAFNELELAFNRMREFLYPESVGENGQ